MKFRVLFLETCSSELSTFYLRESIMEFNAQCGLKPELQRDLFVSKTAACKALSVRI
jgi:hypothetical protein